ncbi:MAG: DASS family sodium-coupled anion symporter [Bacteroidales bacterium]|nr:DASS family sodium-coupled anion symporter [Bacteroidales bacterium]MCB9012584.1 DASS family sodium-coupled anion symporter [Bacteroidales bacterium]
MSKKYIGLLTGLALFLLILFLPNPSGMSTEAKNALAVVTLMTVWWIAESIPIYATAFIPLVLYPLFKVLPAGETAENYGHSYVLMMLAGFLLAKAIESSNLHKRIALILMNSLGASRKRLMLSLMIATAFISMCIANVTSALLMLPIALAIISRDEEVTGGKTSFSTAMMLGTAYSASIGGVATLIGSPTNLIFLGIMEKLFPNAPPISFLTWLKIGLPVTIIFLPVVWYFLVRYFKIKGSIAGSHAIVKEELKSLGIMSSAEKRVMMVFAVTTLGWIFRDDLVFGQFKIPGWSEILGLQNYVHDSTVAMASAIVLFAMPDGKGSRLLEWKSASQIPWGVVMIVGGGYAIAAGFQSTGLASWMGNQLAFISDYPFWLVLIIVVAFILFFTEINSNTATANIFLPVLASIAVAGHTNPLLLMIPATFASTFAFMMPAGTGPNTVIFASEKVSIVEMVRCGFWLKLISLVLLTLILYFIIIPILNLETGLPVWAQ